MKWEDVEEKVLVALKEYLVKHFSSEVLSRFNSRIMSIVYNYTAHLPRHVVTSEFDDLANIAKIEFVETIKSWDPKVKDDVWKLAYSRITGAMKDHMRYLTKADPGRVYEWVTDAAYVFLSVNSDDNIHTKIENNVQLYSAMKNLSMVERTVISQRYKNDKTFKEIGLEINLSESQITRIYKEAVRKLKKVMGDK